MKKAFFSALLSIGTFVVVWGGMEYVVNGFDFAKAIANINLPIMAAIGGALAVGSAAIAYIKEKNSVTTVR